MMSGQNWCECKEYLIGTEHKCKLEKYQCNGQVPQQHLIPAHRCKRRATKDGLCHWHMQQKINATLKRAEQMRTLIDSGYAGVLSSGKIVDRREYPAAIPGGNTDSEKRIIKRTGAKAVIHEDQLPATITVAQYAEWFKQSKVIDGVRMGPDFLLPCPYCGSAARLVERTHDPEAYPPDNLEAIPIWVVECSAWCIVYTDNQAEAITAWNKRV